MNNYRVYLEWTDHQVPWTANFTIEASSVEDTIRKVRNQTSTYLNVHIRSIIRE